MKNDSTAANISKAAPTLVERRVIDLSSMMDNQVRYMRALFIAIKATSEESSKVAVDLAALGQWVAENAEDFLDVGCKDVLSASREVH
ncbi:TPA: hypothetical protein SLZ45_003364 [Burkholderia multivorans]|uniref:hypothetical protein n=1 Tax=Burkholderia multivorans TaxID=87883 RepID=UPI000CFFA7F0|nr:hypothetical protein [Burkholderia multivorans]PRE27526.1 hypothetical protein C6P79_14480 [Burkholderia multivorans]HEJ2441838.1 hypothetical protein [Burkholderia multivorans]